MATVGIRDLTRDASKIVAEVERTGKATVVTRRGRPTVAMVPIDQDELEDWILANAREFVEGMKQAEREYRQGKTTPLDEALAEIETEEVEQKATRRGKRKRAHR